MTRNGRPSGLSRRRSAARQRRSTTGSGWWNVTPGRRPGLTTDERQRLKLIERENRELKRANEILRKASAVFAQAELDRRPR